jgi:hypothetical protein
MLVNSSDLLKFVRLRRLTRVSRQLTRALFTKPVMHDY